MQPSLEFVYEEKLKSEIMALLEMVDRVIADRAAVGAHCSFNVDGFECQNAEETFCGRCEMGLCSCHARSFGVSPYCPNCFRRVRAEMLPILHQAGSMGGAS